MIDRIASQAFGVVTAPVRLGLRVASALLGRESEAEPVERQRREPGPDPQRDPTPKALDDVALARKVESVVFRRRGVDKGKIDVNAADGVVWLRGEARTPDLIRELERAAKEIPEVKRVENLLHLPKTPAPSRTDTPARERKTRRSPRRQQQRPVRLGKVTAEEVPAEGEPTPADIARRRGGRPSAPLGQESDEE